MSLPKQLKPDSNTKIEIVWTYKQASSPMMGDLRIVASVKDEGGPEIFVRVVEAERFDGHDAMGVERWTHSENTLGFPFTVLLRDFLQATRGGRTVRLS